MSWAGGFVSFCIVCIAGAPTAKPAASHADRAWREWAVYPLHGAGINPEPLGDLTHARAPRCRQSLPDAFF